ncbi:hypothetical protein GLOIN_2v1716380 [Rhizophagus irregularis DAOM 181602=DAOM 197198]|uniref:Uncharacterized protein n=1 Tax=Rhizophagus irregularis (strain DAOM 181602 / DAOM 197198 / MUCL 43194) TaxID=747089 RepID=A0A2P4P406_RHIID|nr:hypothetical protein GLOIN_2v1716380 [Rhizophagus irregularis DAOM 181602=DAOM 197198]POG60123.1 hypothetical protein GLOIN_2v1716380 [Rhizophagus irregularis DAOM 181602=DAOM 197198]GBC29276.2 hypothetical protein GLOIN_2v1716380 [Rhizophagus irregularis DAOM 181602=DAOM 197198]|eukprot:XP_025166989.1 hypothetical protein GLOIN_2v1716380 [Rhizophagus irregularis DAOM 181602=DAOM 197198]
MCIILMLLSTIGSNIDLISSYPNSITQSFSSIFSCTSFSYICITTGTIHFIASKFGLIPSEWYFNIKTEFLIIYRICP